MRAGFIQTSPVFGDKEHNFDQAAELSAGIRADLLVLPELFATGYAFTSPDEARDMAEPADGPTAGFLRKLSGDTGAAIVAGYIEEDRGKLYNSALLVHHEEIIGNYRKIHLFNKEKLWFSPGNRPPEVYSVMGTRIGMMICFDWYFPETARTLALKGAEVIAHPSNLVMPWCQRSMPTRCLENRVFAITANRIGRETRGPDDFLFTGASQVTAPDGTILASGPVGLVMATLVEFETALAGQKKINSFNDVLLDRRPELYH